MMTLFTLSAILSMLLVLSKPPLMMALLITAQTALVSLSMYLLMPTSWMSFVLLMILVSAMMVIFVYVSSLASNEFVALPKYWAMSTTATLSVWLLLGYLFLYTKKSQACSHSSMWDTDLTPILTHKLYEPYASTLTIFLIIYLLLALIVVAKISVTLKGSLRAMKN
uniref:NADH dehydrogenase subunit 6 n=1 Tax=Pallaseopsis kessleri TaxID=686709 RepID=A0A1L5BW61_9CRUS|nr:NADH dehydrogenase subunit 6 [Pallaseopsis kessleri]APL97205.1 NADH dehydrogenase subunit 6 [Pallaseopsis kessleri]